MRTKFCDLIVISPVSPKIWKVKVTPQALLILGMAFLLSFTAAAAATYGLAPEKLDAAHHARLEAENYALKIENKNTELQNRRLETRLSNLEGTSDRISDLMESN
ncbi:MAG TPA: hypothetical protein VE422_08665 [Terriglobia bacterium]|nr:hypothetical protein [Terriglobia bacterium]